MQNNMAEICWKWQDNNKTPKHDIGKTRQMFSKSKTLQMVEIEKLTYLRQMFSEEMLYIE